MRKKFTRVKPKSFPRTLTNLSSSTTILTNSLAQPERVRAGDALLFEKDVKRLVTSIHMYMLIISVRFKGIHVKCSVRIV